MEGDISTQLDNYIREGRKTGMTDEAIRSNLRHVGWTEVQIEASFNFLDSPQSTFTATSGFVDSSVSELGLSGSDIETSRMPDRKKMIKVGLLTIVAFLLLGGSIWGYFLLSPTITKYLALSSLGKIETGRIDGRLVLRDRAAADQKQAELSEVKFLLNGFVDGRELKTDLNAKLEVPSGYISPQVNFMTFGDKIYFQLTKFPFPQDPSKPQLQDVWYSYQEKSEGKDSGGSREVTAEKGKKVSKSFSDAKVFKKFRKITDESVDGIDCKQYTFELDLNKLADLLIKTSSEGGQLMTETEKTKIKKTIQGIMSMKGSFLVGKEDRLIHRLDLYTETKDMAVDATLRISEINKEHKFTEPTEAKSFQETFGIKDQPLPIFSPSDSSRSPI